MFKQAQMLATLLTTLAYVCEQEYKDNQNFSELWTKISCSVDETEQTFTEYW